MFEELRVSTSNFACIYLICTNSRGSSAQFKKDAMNVYFQYKQLPHSILILSNCFYLARY
jgi:hypothetical protein